MQCRERGKQKNGKQSKLKENDHLYTNLFHAIESYVSRLEPLIPPPIESKSKDIETFLKLIYSENDLLFSNPEIDDLKLDWPE